MFSMMAPSSLSIVSSVDVQEPFAVEQRPQQILSAAGFGATRKILHAAIAFRRAGQAAHRGEVQLFDNCRVAFSAQNQLRDAALRIGDRIRDGPAVYQIEGLGKAE